MLSSGVCILDGRQTFVMVCFNHATKRFDGFAIFRTSEVGAYRYWDKEMLQKVKKNNWKDYLLKINLESMKTFYSGLKNLPSEELVAVFTNKNTEEYYVGKVHSISRDTVTLRLIDESARWINLKKIKIKDIDHFSFGTKYELKLAKNAT